MRTPTTAEFEEAFSLFKDEHASEEMYKAVGALLREAKRSEMAIHTALGFAPSLLRSITAAGADFSPILKTILIGFYLGQQFTERHPADPPINTDDMDRFLRRLDADEKRED